MIQTFLLDQRIKLRYLAVINVEKIITYEFLKNSL